MASTSSADGKQTLQFHEMGLDDRLLKVMWQKNNFYVIIL